MSIPSVKKKNKSFGRSFALIRNGVVAKKALGSMDFFFKQWKYSMLVYLQEELVMQERMRQMLEETR